MGARNYSLRSTLRRLRRFWAVCRQTGNYPETGLAEINSDLLEADFWGVRGSHRNKGVSQAGI